MEITNAFAAHAAKPSASELAGVLGPSAPLWDNLIGRLSSECGIDAQEWSSSSPRRGWALKLNRKKRTIAYLTPSNGCFGVAVVLGNKAVEAAKRGAPASLVQLISESPKYSEGTGVRLLVKNKKDLAPVETLAKIKLAN